MKKLLFLASALIIASPIAWAQGGSRANCTTVGPCGCIHGRVDINKDGLTFTSDFSGSMSIECLDTGTTSIGLWWWKHRSLGFSVTGTEATLGTIHVYLDASRTQPDSWLTSLNAGSNFPASHHVYAYAEATMSSAPGTIYRSTQPFHMYNDAIPSLGVPGAHIEYTVASDIDFEDVANPGVVAFTVKATPIIVNP